MLSTDNLILLQKLLTALIPVPVFYLIYFRYFTFKPEYIKHLESFLYGVALALLIILVSPFLYSFIPFTGSISEGFIKAAFVEKVGAFLLIYLIQKYYPNFSVMESIISSMMLGIGFSLVENLFYALNYGYSIILIRLVVSVPLHLTTCGIIGYYLGLRKISVSRFFRLQYTLKALLLPILLHGTFDAILLKGGTGIYLVGPMLILLVIILELMSARAHTIFPQDILEAMNLRFEDWLTINRQPRYDRWIMRSMGTPNTEKIPFFQLQKGLFRWFIILVFAVTAVVLMKYKGDIIQWLNLSLKKQEEFFLMGMYPASISFILLLVGAINPKFIEDSIIRIPIICDVSVRQKGSTMEETFVTYDITGANCILKTSLELEVNSEVEVVFETPGFSSPRLKGIVVWENFTNQHATMGSIVKLVETPWSFYAFLFRYYLFRIRKGLAFNLKLPGHEGSRRLFMRPISTMQKERFFNKGTIIFNEGDMGTEFYLLKKGKVMFYKKKGNDEIIVMDTMEAGEIFGEMTIVGNQPRAATAVCLTDCILAVADIHNLNALIRSNPDFAQSLIKQLAERVHMSESILSENIRNLENEKRQAERIFHVSLMLILIGLGYNPDRENMTLKLDLRKISEVVKHMDDDTASEIINLMIKKQLNVDFGEGDIQEKIINVVDELYQKYKLDVKF